MASSAALISYPCFKDLERSNITFVQSGPHQNKFQKSRCDKREKLADKNSLLKENSNVEYGVTCNRENFTKTPSRVKVNDIKMLPILDENEEKEEVKDHLVAVDDFRTVDFIILNNKLYLISKVIQISVSPRSLQRQTICTKVNANSILSSHETETTKPKSKSNNTLVALNAFTSELVENESIKQPKPNGESELLEESPVNYNLCLTKYKPDTAFGSNEPKTNKGCSHILKCEENKTSMPNTKEFAASLTFPRKCLPSNTGKSKPSYWKIILALLWYFSFTGVMIYMVTINIANSPIVTENHEPINLKPTNYEIVLLIGRNFRRLIVS